MRVIIVSSMDMYSPTGVTKYNKLLIDNLLRLKMEVDFITHTNLPYLLSLPAKLIFRLLKYYPENSSKVLIRELLQVFNFFLIGIIYRLKNQKTIIVHGQDITSTYGFCLGYGMKRVKKKIMTCHFNDNPVEERRIEYNLRKNSLKLLDSWFKCLFSKCDDFIFVSEYCYNKSKYLLNEKSRIHIIYNAVSFDKSNLKVSKQRDKILKIICVGTLENRKNQILLLKSAKHLKERGFLFKVDLYGNGQMYDELLNFVEKNGLDDNVIFKGFKSNLNLYEIDADILIHPAVNENCSMTIIEAFAAKIPVLALNVGGNGELLRNGSDGLVAKNIEPKCLAERIIELSSGNRLTELADEQFKYACDKFNIHQMILKVKNIYENSTC